MQSTVVVFSINYFSQCHLGPEADPGLAGPDPSRGQNEIPRPRDPDDTGYFFLITQDKSVTKLAHAGSYTTWISASAKASREKVMRILDKRTRSSDQFTKWTTVRWKLCLKKRMRAFTHFNVVDERCSTLCGRNFPQTKMSIFCLIQSNEMHQECIVKPRIKI